MLNSSSASAIFTGLMPGTVVRIPASVLATYLLAGAVCPTPAASARAEGSACILPQYNVTVRGISAGGQRSPASTGYGILMPEAGYVECFFKRKPVDVRLIITLHLLPL